MAEQLRMLDTRYIIVTEGNLKASYLFEWNEVRTGYKKLGQIFYPVLLFSLQLILFLQKLGQRLCRLSARRNLR